MKLARVRLRIRVARRISPSAIADRTPRNGTAPRSCRKCDSTRSRDASNRLDSARVADVKPCDHVWNSVGGGPRFRSTFAVGQAVSARELPIDRGLDLVEPRTAGRIDPNEVHTRRPRRSHDQAPIELEVTCEGGAGGRMAAIAVHSPTASRTRRRADSVSGRPSVRTISAVGNPSDLSHRASDGSNS